MEKGELGDGVKHAAIALLIGLVPSLASFTGPICWKLGIVEQPSYLADKEE